MFMQTESNTGILRGTIKSLVQQGIKANGKPVDAVSLSIFAKYGVDMQNVGEEKPLRGRTAAVYEVKLKNLFSV